MLRGNLSTRPFYNERAVQAGLAGLAVVLGLLTVFTAWQLVALTSRQRELSSRIAADESRAASLRREAQQVRGRVDPRALEATVRATNEANAVIDQRTFSWTALFNVIERTIPADVRLRAATPSFDRDTLIIRFVVNATRVESVGVFLDRLETAGAFAGLRSVDEQVLEDGSFNVVCEGRYLGPGAPEETPPVEEAPAAGAGVAGAN
jgi:hypothetical protein